MAFSCPKPRGLLKDVVFDEGHKNYSRFQICSIRNHRKEIKRRRNVTIQLAPSNFLSARAYVVDDGKMISIPIISFSA
jgi:hypothetical protein